MVLIVGRPNVGKSTLFNRLVGKAAAVVFDRPGVTRDMLEAEVDIGTQKIRLMDTAGWPYPGDDIDLSGKINRIVEGALKKSALILWMVEGPEGRTAGEDAFAERLQAHRKKIVLVVNKLDELHRPSSAWADSEFAGLPWDVSIPVTAKHGRGIADLLSLLETRLGGTAQETDSAPTPAMADLKISILGRPNVGKSTLTNLLLKQDRMVVSDIPGTTRDAVESVFEYNGRRVTLIDTAGVRRIDRVTDGLERTTSKIALSTGRQANVTLLMMDISQGLAEQDLRLLSHLWRGGTCAVAVANKWDMVADRAGDSAASLEKEFRRRAHEAQEVPFVLISAKTGHGLTRLMETAFLVRDTAERRIRTPELNRRMQEWTSGLPSGLFQGNIGKLKYAVQTQTAPISFKIFVNNPKFFRREAIRYLEKRFRESFDLHGVPLHLNLVTDK